MAVNKTGRVIRAMSELIDYIKTRTATNILEYNATDLKMSRGDLEKLVNVMNASISQAYSQGMDSVLNEIEK